MKEQQNSIDEFFRESLSDYREAPPAAAWDQVARRLDENEGRRSFLRWPWVVLSLLLIVGSIWVVTGVNTSIGNNPNQATVSGNQTIQSTSHFTPHQEVPTDNQTEQVQPLKDQPLSTLTKPQDANLTSNNDEDSRTSAIINTSKTIAASSSVQPGNPAEVPDQQEQIVTEAAAIIAMAPAKLKLRAPAVAAPSIVTKPIPAEVAASLTPESELSTIVESPSRAVSVGAAKLASALIAAQQETRPFVPHEPREVEALSGTQQKPLSQKEPMQTPGQLTKDNRPIPETIIPANPIVAAAERVIAQAQDQAQRTADPIDPLSGSSWKQMTAAPSVSTPGQLVADNRPIRETHIAADPKRNLTSTNTDIVPGTSLAIPASNASSSVKTSVATDKPVEELKPEVPDLSKPLPFSVAALAGYERGLKPQSGNRYTASLRLLWQASQSVAVGIQPAFRFGNLPAIALTNSRIFHRSSIHVDSFRTVDSSPSVVNRKDTIFNYRITETFDSIMVAGTSAGGNYWQAELPLIVHCKLNNSWYVYGGPSLNFGGKLNYNDAGTPEIKTVKREDFLSQSEQLPPAAFNNYFGKSSLEPYSNYKPAEAPNDPTSVRLGYVAGLGYGWKKLMGELSIHQQLSGYKAVAAPLRDFYATPHIRLSLGYLLFAPKANKNNAK